MILPIVIYLACVAVLAAATTYLVRRDLREAEAQRQAAATPSLRRLPTPVDERPVPGWLGRFDQGFDRIVYQTGLDISSQAALLLMILIGLMIGGSLFVWLENPFVAIAGFLTGLGVTWCVFLFLRGRRLSNVRNQLPDVMDLMARSVRAGESIDQAVDAVGKSFAAPLGIEFQRCGRQLSMGLAMHAAMKALTYRAPVTEMRILAATFNVQRRTGGNIAENLDRLAHVIRDRLNYQRQFAASTGGTRLATILIALAGPVVFGVMLMVQPEYMIQFFTQPGGISWLVRAAVLQAVGLTWIYYLMRNTY